LILVLALKNENSALQYLLNIRFMINAKRLYSIDIFALLLRVENIELLLSDWGKCLYCLKSDPASTKQQSHQIWALTILFVCRRSRVPSPSYWKKLITWSPRRTHSPRCTPPWPIRWDWLGRTWTIYFKRGVICCILTSNITGKTAWNKWIFSHCPL